MNVFVGPVEIAGIARNLVIGLNEQGINAQLITKTKHPFLYSNLRTKRYLALWQFLFLSRAKSKTVTTKALFFILTHLYSHCILVWALIKFDAFLFFGAQSITNSSLELKLLKVFSKKVIFVYTGSDARPLYMNGAHVHGLNDADVSHLAKNINKQRKRLSSQEKYADYIVNAPGTAQFQTKPFINWFKLGIPTDLPRELSPTFSSESVKILHCPSNPTIKGSNKISEVIKRLQDQGHDIDFIELTNAPNSVVLENIRGVDIVIDQLYSDTPMATFATEAASFGKPVIVAGYFADQSKSLNDDEFWPPTLFVSPDNFEEKLVELIVNKKVRKKIAEECFNFVSRQWKKDHVCMRYIQLLNDSVPVSWWIKPDQISYIYGCGAPKQELENSWRLLLENFGKEAFCIDDKPELLRRIMQKCGVHGFD